MRSIEGYNQELADARAITVRLMKGKESELDFEFRYWRLFENLNIARMRKMALYYESNKARSVHPWLAMSATHPQLLTQVHYYHILSVRINHAHEQLRLLSQKRDSLIEKLADMRARADEALSKETIVAYMEKYTEDLSMQDTIISAMHEKVHDHLGQSIETVAHCRRARVQLTQRKEHALDLKRRTAESHWRQPPSKFIAEPNPVFAEPMCAFRPHPPAEPTQCLVPTPALEFPAKPPLVAAPQSQRARRPTLMGFRKRLTRPVQTARKN
jgi:hypothetical protein